MFLFINDNKYYFYIIVYILIAYIISLQKIALLYIYIQILKSKYFDI